MRAVLAAMSLITTQLVAADLKVDHVTIAGPDLAALSKMFADAGIPVEYGGKHTNGVLVAAKRFYAANPKTCAAVLAAFNGANAFIKANPRQAAEIYIAATKDKEPPDSLAKMVADPDVDRSSTCTLSRASAAR